MHTLYSNPLLYSQALKKVQTGSHYVLHTGWELSPGWPQVLCAGITGS